MTRAAFEPGAKIERLGQNLGRPTAALKQIGALMVAESQQAFRDQRLGKHEWPARSVPNVMGIIADFASGKRAPPARRFEDRPALRDTGRLAASIAFRLVGADSVEVGSSLPYADTHQRGGRSESATITEQVQRLLGRWLGSQGAEMRQRLGWLMNEKFRGTKLTADVPKRPFVGVTDDTIKAVQLVVGAKIMEAE